MSASTVSAISMASKEPKSKTIDNILYTSFTVVKNDDYDKLIEFYTNLGFRVIRTFEKEDVRNLPASVMNDISLDSRRECWLEFFPVSRKDKKGNVIPIQETIEYKYPELKSELAKVNTGVSLKIRLVSHDVHKNVELPGRLVLTTYGVSQLRTIAQKFGLELISPKPEEADFVDFFISDPVGNLIGFTDMYDFVNRLRIKSRDDFFADPAKVEEVEKKAKGVDIKTGKKRIAILTSGGDAQGMCAVVRSVVRAGIYMDCEVFGCYEGYYGLVKGGDLLKKLEWADVRGWLSLGGTLIGTARCQEFREREGRLLAAKNMVLRGIDALVVCGGDGSLTGADLFRSEWPSLIDELVQREVFTEEDVEPYKHLTIVGLVGSIDNDMAYTDNTIGAYSSLERICEMVDYIDSTAASHSRAFVVEVMGRNCGWLALMAGICCGADYAFLPERPPSANSWKDELKQICLRHREKGRRKTTVIVAEGAIDDSLKKITSEDVKDCLVEIGLDTRITQLGHVQRGGTAVAFDRYLSTMQGVEAIKAVLENTPETQSPMIGIQNNRIVRVPLVEAVAKTKSVAKAISEHRFDDAIALRDPIFRDMYENFVTISTEDDGKHQLPESKRLNVGIVHVGAPTAAVNAATRSVVLYLLSKGHKPLGINNGFSGLIRRGSVREFGWLDVEEWHNLGGSELGTNRGLPSEDFGAVAYHLQYNKIDGLIIIGGFEAFQSLKELKDARDKYPVFNIPIVCLPSTVSNNVPGTEYSLGTDTCLNVLVNYCDAVKQSASSSRRRVFIIEVQGGKCGYIASYIGLVTGALAVYTPEDQITLKMLREDIELLDKSFANDRGDQRSGKVFIRNERASKVYSTEMIADVIREAANGKYESRTAVPGHVQQGKIPSSMDRIYATQFGIKACKFIEEKRENFLEKISRIVENDDDINDELIAAERGLGYVFERLQKLKLTDENNAVICGIQGSCVEFKDIDKVWNEETNISYRKSNIVHWKDIIEVNDILSGRAMIQEGKF